MNRNQLDLFLAILFCLVAVVYLFLGYWNDYKRQVPNAKLIARHQQLKYIVWVGAFFPLVVALGAVLVVWLFFDIS